MKENNSSEAAFELVPSNEVNPAPRDSLDLTFGHGTINALTFRSFVSPKAARPDIQNYEQISPIRDRGSYIKSQMKSFNVTSSRHIIENEHLEEKDKKKKEPKKFGPWDGVCTSCLLNIFGVIMFLRLGWVVGQVGVPLTLVIIGISTVVTTLTTFSMAAICTNGKVKEGGAYYLISRAIGPNIGGAIGFLFAVGQSVAIAMYVIGFCETLSVQLESFGISLTGDTLWDVRVYGLILLCINLIMVLIGTDWVIKLQIGLLVLLVGAIITFIVGSFGDPLNPLNPSSGFVGYGSGELSKNLKPEYREGYDFFTVFGVFFPAVTGIMAGANISGDLKNPSRDIPLGTITAIVVSTIVYSIMAIMCGAVAQRVVGQSTELGLVFDSLIMVKISLFKGVLVIIGIYAATFSSALASLVGGPRILQRLSMDGIVPFLDYFSVIRERDAAPVRGYFFSATVAASCILIGELNLVAPLITMFFMLTYGLINFSCFVLTLSKSPGWRPTFRYVTWWSSLLGALLCFIIMILTSVTYAIVSLIVGWAIYKYVQYKAVNVNWGSAVEARRDAQIVKGLLKLRNVQSHIKTFRPHYLVLIGNPSSRLWLVRLVETLYFGRGAVIYGNVIKTTFDKYFEIQDCSNLTNSTNSHLDLNSHDQEKNEKDNVLNVSNSTMNLRKGYWSDPKNSKYTAGFLDTVVCEDFRTGCQSLLQVGGVGRFRPNIMVMGYPDWVNDNPVDMAAYTNVIKDAFRLGLSVMVARGFKDVNFDMSSAELMKSQGTLDVWWLADDGGLTILVCYICLLHNFWKQQISKVNIFVIVESSKKIEALEILMAQLVSKFRVKIGKNVEWDPQPIVATPVLPDQSSRDHYEKLTKSSIDKMPKTRKHTILRWLRVAEIISETSKNANLIVSLMPFPDCTEKGQDYLALLEMLSNNNCPTILMRGNGQNVMTFEME